MANEFSIANINNFFQEEINTPIIEGCLRQAKRKRIILECTWNSMKNISIITYIFFFSCK